MADPEILEEKKSDGQAKAAGKGIPLNMNVIIMVVAGLFAVGIALGASFFMVSALSKAQPAQEAASTEATKEKPKEKPAAKKAAHGGGEAKKESHGGGGHGEGGESASAGASNLYKFDKPIIVNLSQTNAERYLKVDIALELDSSGAADEVRERLPQVLDLLINILSNKTLDDISSTSGRNMLRQEMIDKINAVLNNGRVVNVYFTEFVVQ
jgi:flagellar basal body-associated protein FliL